MSVYVITCRSLGVAKIGYSNAPHRRAQFLRTGSPAPIKLEAVVPADERNEKELHSALSFYRAHGEWFKICPSIEQLIAAFPIGKAPRRVKEAEGAAGIVNALGGTVAVATALELTPSTVSSWKISGSIPAWRWPALIPLAEAKGVELPTQSKAA